MEILTLIKADIIHKKSSFISIVILMMIISLILSSVISVRESSFLSTENALDISDAANLTVFISKEAADDNMINAVKDNKNVEKFSKSESFMITDVDFEGGGIPRGILFAVKYTENYRLLKPDLSCYSDTVKIPEKSEIYVSQGLLTDLSIDVGAKITLHTGFNNYEKTYDFIVSGIVADPLMGSTQIEHKRIFMNDEDFGRISEELHENSELFIFEIYKSADCNLTDSQFKRQLNVDTGIINLSEASVLRSKSLYYTNTYPETILSVMVVFLLILMVILLIVIHHSVTSSIEAEYVNIGILKAIGFTKWKIRIIFSAQYILAQIVGTVIGFIFSVPIANFLGNIFKPITALPYENRMSFGICTLIIFAVLIVSSVFIVISTSAVSKLSPVNAISGGKEDIYFDSLLRFPISKKFLVPSIALRQFTSDKKRYLSSIIITSLLVFFMITATVLGDTFNSKTALESMGEIYTDFIIGFVEFKGEDSKLGEGFYKIDEIEKYISEYTNIEKKYYIDIENMSVMGEFMDCTIYANPDAVNILRGRYPKYSNEIVITEIVSKDLALGIGDKVTVSYQDKKDEYIITGIMQSIRNEGHCFAMNFEGAKKLGIKCVMFAGYSVDSRDNLDEMKNILNEKYGDIIQVYIEEEISYFDETTNLAVFAVRTVIYIFSVIFALVVVYMVCSKFFIREKPDIGIYKSLGFKTSSLRMQFALRFLMVSVIGSVIGSILSLMFSAELLSVMLSNIGITNFKLAFYPTTFLIPITIICLCFFVFSYLVSWSINKTDVKILITE